MKVLFIETFQFIFMRKPFNSSLILTMVKRHLAKFSWFIVVFAFIKINGFSAALFLSNFVVNVADYGLFEYALSVGFVLAVIFNFGLQGAYPYFNLKLRKEGYHSLFHAHALILGGSLLSLFLFNYSFYSFIPSKFLFALLIGSIVALQVMSSVILKSHEILQKAVFFDGGFFLVLNGYNAHLWLTGQAFDIQILQLTFAVYLLFLTTWHGFAFWKNRMDFSMKRYFEALSFGRHLVLSSFLIISLTGSARIFIEWFLNLEEVGYYGFYFRFASVTVIIHQIINIIFFKKMYQSDARILDRYFALFLNVLVIGGLVAWQIIPFIFNGILSLLEDSYATYNPLYFILTFQMIFWIALALNENIIYREGLSKKMNKGFLFIILGMLISLWALHSTGYLNVFWLTIVNMVAIFLGTEFQFLLLKQKKINLLKMKLSGRGIMMLFWIGYCLI
ncbi:MAG: O-antigen/teichoic acid export membrane protein [Paraglaciecola sp.]|jgi:O-antigen/teichoic acid export membrane protein